MSTLLPGALTAGLLDDAAVFPPGNAPVPQAVTEHRRMRTRPYASMIGPLLVAPPMVDALLTAAAETSDALDVSLIARAGTDAESLRAALTTLGRSSAVRLVGFEVAHDPDGAWREALTSDLPVAVEVARAASVRDAQLDDVAALAGSVVAKLRTQATPDAPAPSAQELADFMVACRDRGLPFKLTGGLHHVLACSEPWSHGAANVLVAVDLLEQGQSADALADALATTHAPTLVTHLRSLDEEAARRVRRRYTSFGCCGVLDPVGEFIAWGLLPDALFDDTDAAVSSATLPRHPSTP